MERERPRNASSVPGGSDPSEPAGDALERARERLNELSDAMDRALDGIHIHAADAELVLQQNRQSGGQ